MANGKIFISYRREDTSGESGRLKDKLEQVFGKENIFYDVETLEAGLNFDESIAKALNESKVLLAMIGPHWLRVADSNGIKRIQKDEDWVRKEIAQALKRNIRVIPVLVNGADMPDSQELPEDLKELTLRHAQELSSSRWNYDVGELTKVLEKIIPIRPIPNPPPVPGPFPKPQPKSWWAKNYLWALGGFVGFLILVGMCVPDEYDTFPENNYSTNSFTEADISGQGNSESENFNNQNTEQLIPDLRGEWNLYLNGQKASILSFGQTGTDVAYYEYDGANNRTGEGKGQIDGSVLIMNYYSSVTNVSGTISMNTTNSGQTWIGSIYIPATGISGQVEIRKN